MLKRNELPDAFEGEKKWVELGTRYRRVSDPLSIANYYRLLKNKDTGAYMDRGRPNRYRFTQIWLEHAQRRLCISQGKGFATRRTSKEMDQWQRVG